MSKIYVDVMAEFTKDGNLIPKSLKWTDGVRYEIDRVTDIRRAASLKAGGAGMRYTCIIGDKRDTYFTRIITCGLWKDNKLIINEKDKGK